MKRIITFFLVVVFMFSLAACNGGDVVTDTSSDSVLGGSSVENTDETQGASTDASIEASTDVNSETNTDENSVTNSVENSETNTDVNSSGSTEDNSGTNTDEQDPAEIDGYNPEIEHKFIVTDDPGRRLVVYDLNLCEGNFKKLAGDEAIIWEWNWEEDPNSKHSTNARWGLDSAKYRYSSYLKKDVIIACASSGWVGIIDYKERCVLWEDNLARGPHSVEMLPNGDLIVAVATNGAHRLVYYPFSAGVTTQGHVVEANSPHGVCWDPKNQCIWSLEFNGVVRVDIENMGTKGAKMIRGSEIKFADAQYAGHAFAPIGGEPGKYWAASGLDLQIFDTETLTLTNSYERFSNLTKEDIKGVCSFSDGTMIQIVGNGNPNIRVTIQEKTDDVDYVLEDVETVVPVPNSGFYKVQVFTKDYQ